MIPFPSISQFRHIVAAVTEHAQYVGRDPATDHAIFDTTRPLPTLTFTGTVKLHGSNTAVVFAGDRPMQFQSRSRALSVTSDYAGFAAAMTSHASALRKLHAAICNVAQCAHDVPIALYGEWCGGSIQGGVALAQLSKMFVYFAVNVDGRWLDMRLLCGIDEPGAKIYHVMRFGTYSIEIPFDAPDVAQAQLDAWTADVEAECPAAKAFGVSGTGEGIVWVCTSPGYAFNSRFWFKTKGDKHALTSSSLSSGGRRRTPATSIAPVVVATVEAFVQEYVSENRLRQGLHVLAERGLEVSIKHTGVFVQWVIRDIEKEEADTLAANASTLRRPLVQKSIATAARSWYLARLQT
ncbi:hypothetical protein SPRG_01341 [Saprolegnia parasitica CBS 223.65]|uniref:RNA ligase domain-containing protein n=1 Tax=Saprolegnia parasitica (strain CBS 223.65) TaxID=695850 RepID=A0A067D4Y0_SAPPC|nr:hypothetical protein SPRG_01341 [Saprolegnia parasitica CBS 223.65]KDO34067.1 hypothetical protein SPRG_01341 [Saprolegnia parasitica CBS 223.65]|eukprot:XP_012194951.1 hypothetical protein SPRG_01341 [Saprolegnia parasitica CBS 223.65]